MKYNVLRLVNIQILKGAMLVLIGVSFALPTVSLDTQAMFLLMVSLLLVYIEDSWENSWEFNVALKDAVRLVNDDSNKIEKLLIYDGIGKDAIGIVIRYKSTRSKRMIVNERHGEKVIRSLNKDRDYVIDEVYTPSIFKRSFLSDGIVPYYMVLILLALVAAVPVYELTMAFLRGNELLNTVTIWVTLVGVAIAFYVARRCLKFNFSDKVDTFM